MAPKPAVSITRETARGDWHAVLSASSFGPKGKNDAEGQFVTLVGEKDAEVTTKTAQVRFGGRGGAIIASTPAKDQASLIVASVREMRKATANGYENDARPGAIPSTVVSIAAKAVKNLTGGAKVRAALGRVPSSQRVEKAPQILADAAQA